MQINGLWVGWGLGDWSHYPETFVDRDPTVRKFRAYARAMYRSYAGHLADNNIFDTQLEAAVVEMQRRLVLDGKLKPGQFIVGVLDLPTQVACGFRKQTPSVMPVIVTVEGHLSNMWVGPSAAIGQAMSKEQLAYWQPYWYDNSALPFANKKAVDGLVDMFSKHALPSGQPFPPGTPWEISGFSQGAMIISEFMEQHVLPENGKLHWRLKDFVRGLAQGNPRREFGRVAEWADDPPPSDTGGIMGDMNGKGLFKTTGTAIESRWRENANTKDLFAQNTRDAMGMNKTAIAKIVCENSWVGGPASVFARALAIFRNVPGEALGVIRSIISAIMFLAMNPNPHYTTVAEPGDIEWMRSGLLAARKDG